MRCGVLLLLLLLLRMTSTVPMRPRTHFNGPARAVAHEMWCTTAATAIFFGVPGSLSAKKQLRS